MALDTNLKESRKNFVQAQTLIHILHGKPTTFLSFTNLQDILTFFKGHHFLTHFYQPVHNSNESLGKHAL